MAHSLEPIDYRGQALCERCGVDAHGQRFRTCAEIDTYGNRLPHEASCEKYRYDGLCADCEDVLKTEWTMNDYLRTHRR